MYCVHCVTVSTESTGLTFLHQRTMSPPPYITIPLCPLHTASTAYYIHWFDLFAPTNNVPTTIYHYSTAYCVHCVLWFDLFVSTTMSPPPYTTIPLCPLHTASTASTVSTSLTFLHQRTMSPPPYITIPLCPLHTASTAYYIHWFDLFAPKTMSPPPYITIPLCPLHTASTGLTFLQQQTMSPLPYTTIPLYTASTGLTYLYQRQCPHHHIPLFHCMLHPLRPLVSPFCIKDNVPITIYHYSTAYCVHCVLWFDFFVSKTMSPPPYTTIPLHPLHPLHPLCTECTV